MAQGGGLAFGGGEVRLPIVNEREARVARNEAISREINEGIEDGRASTPPDQYLRIVCECGSATCERLIAIRPAEYEAIRSDPTHFAVIGDHVAPDVERVVDETDRFVTVEKLPGLPAEIVKEVDPRS
jgi:hypothetical protein